MSKRKKVWLLTVEETAVLYYPDEHEETWYHTLITDDIDSWMILHADALERKKRTRGIEESFHIVNAVKIPLPTEADIERMELHKYIQLSVYLYHTALID